MGSKWDKLFGLEHPEAYGKIEDPEDKEKHLYATDVPDITLELLTLICKGLNIKTEFIWDRYSKTLKEHRKRL